MTHYIIDGNNLIGKIPSLKKSQAKDNQANRFGLISILNSYFAGKKITLSLHFDGFEKEKLHLSKGKLIYSNNKSSDTKIREEIERSKNPKLITLISSDREIINFARVNSCSVILSEDFYSVICKSKEINEEKQIIKDLEADKEYFKEVFTKEKS